MSLYLPLWLYTSLSPPTLPRQVIYKTFSNIFLLFQGFFESRLEFFFSLSVLVNLCNVANTIQNCSHLQYNLPTNFHYLSEKYEKQITKKKKIKMEIVAYFP